MAQETIDAIRQAEAAAESAETEEVKELEALRSAVAEKQQQAVKVILSELL